MTHFVRSLQAGARLIVMRQGTDMGFLSFNEKYYARKLDEYESGALSDAQIYELKQLLKVLDDLCDEGYYALSERLEDKFRCVTRLKAVLERCGERPFAVDHTHAPISYGKCERELDEFLSELTFALPDPARTEGNDLLVDIVEYSRFLCRDKDVAYIFLLRDCLLPYLRFAKDGKEGLYAYPIGRAFLRDISGEENFDDAIRLPIYSAAEEGLGDFYEFKEFFARETAKTLRAYPRVKDTLARLLDAIPYEKVTVVESGYCGTVPMLLSATDGRVDFKMYTTAPFFFDVYRDRIFCKRYERLRLFETLKSQDALFEYAAFKDGKFYVRTTEDKCVLDGAKEEIAFVRAQA